MKEFPFSEIDPHCFVSDNLDHILYTFEGYRSYVMGNREPPYSPGSARDVSWKIGYEKAKKDLGATKLYDND